MAEQTGELRGPDLEAGIALADLPDGRSVLGHAAGEAVLLVRQGERVSAIGATCTHYGGPLADGLVDGETVRCPWHHACFSLRTGEALAAPALNPVARWRVELDGGTARVTGKETAAEARRVPPFAPASVAIVGAGAAGSAAAEMLRREGYFGPLTMIDPDAAAPYDRPNLSKDFLAGTAPEEWIPLRPEGYYAELGIDRVVAAAASLDVAAQHLALSDGRTLEFGALLLATGATPRRLDVPGADLPHVHLLRSLEDSRAIIAAADRANRAVVLGASFIGLEVAASLRNRGLEVTVVAPETVPFAPVLGDEIGRFLRRLHEEHGVVFELGRTAAAIDEGRVRLDDGSELAAQLVVIGVGVRPAVELARAAGLAVDDGVLVDAFLETSAPGIFAAGDAARFPDPRTGERIRIEHWAVAQRQGQAAARNILGHRKPFSAAPFFWTAHYGVTVAYVGHAHDWDDTRVSGDPAERDCAVAFLRDNRELALATIFRDRASLAAELDWERQARAKAGSP